MVGAKKSKLSGAFGRVLRHLRQEKRYTQEGLALEAGVERNFVSLIERGLNQPSIATLFKFAKALDCAPSRIVALVEKELAS